MFTFENYCKINGLDASLFKAPPHTFEDYLDTMPITFTADIDGTILYDGYVNELQQLGYVVYGNANYGIGIKKGE